MTITDFINGHRTTDALIVYYVFSNAVSTMPAPNGNKFYTWAYAFLHALAGNIADLVRKHIEKPAETHET